MMNVIFYHIGPDVSMPRMLAESIRKTGHNPVFLTDNKTAGIEGCETHRFGFTGENVVWKRMLCYAEYNQEGIYLDSDMMVMKNLEPIMALDFDVCLTRQDRKVVDPNGVCISDIMNYNGGFAIVRNPNYWPHIVMKIQEMNDEAQHWWGDQLAMMALVDVYKTLILPCSLYNFTPSKHEDMQKDMSDKWMIHFKGKRKPWMGEMK